MGKTQKTETRSAYVGQTGDLRARLTAHNQKKDFWERALVLVSKTNSLTQTHALFLEWHALQQIRGAGRFADENGNSGSRPHTPAPLEAECFEVFETGSVLVSSLGYPLFDPDILARYNANRLRVVRQVRYSLHNENCIDLVLFLNGIPVATVELKTDNTQGIEDAVWQYKTDRLPGSPAKPLSRC